jgi:hypothetical protein
MPMVITPDSALGRELWKWDHRMDEVHPADEDKPSHEQLRGVRPTQFQPFPQMLYKAQTHPITKQMRCMDIEPNMLDFTDIQTYQRAVNQINLFNQACSCIVQDDEQRRKKLNDGWAESVPKAMDAVEQRDIAIADAAAARHFSDQRMSRKAQDEAADADRSTSAHVLDVVGSSKKTRGRPAKSRAVTASTK